MVMQAYSPSRVRKEFWSKVDKTDYCWNWTGAKSKQGYGMVKINGKQITAHRASFIIAGCDLPQSIIPDHLCRNTSCVRFDHLELVTYSENNRRRWHGPDPAGYLGSNNHNN